MYNGGMTLRQLREANNLTQPQLAELLKTKKNFKCGVPDISKAENGAFETYAIITAYCYEVLADYQENNSHGFKAPCKPSEYEKTMKDIYKDGKRHTRDEFCKILNLTDSIMRKVNSAVRCEIPILHNPSVKGSWLFENEEDIHFAETLLREMENTKKLISMQERPLIAKLAEIKKKHGGD